MSSTNKSGPSEMPYVYKPDADESASEAVITAVATATGQSLLEVEPLFNTLDPDALDAMFTQPSSEDSSVVVSFEYAGYDVSVLPDEIRLGLPT